MTQFACHGHVRQDHALFDQLVRLHARMQRDGMNALVRVNVESGLGRIEVEGTAGPPRLDEHAVHIHQWQQPVHQGPDLFTRLGLTIEQRILRLVVGESRGRAHHGRIEARRLQCTLARHDHIRGQTQPINVWRQ